MLLCAGAVSLAISASLRKMGHLGSVFFVSVQWCPRGREETGSFLHHPTGELCVRNESCYYFYCSEVIVSEYLLFPSLAFQS